MLLTFNILTLKEKRNKKSKGYNNKLGSYQHPDLNSAGKSHYIWSPNWERVPGSTSDLWVRLQRLQVRIPIYNPRMQTNNFINL